MRHVLKVSAVLLAAAALVAALGACAVDDYKTLAGSWTGDIDESEFLSSGPSGMSLTITIDSSKYWSWIEKENGTDFASAGSGTYTLDSSAKTAKFTIKTCSSSWDVATGTVVKASYTVSSDGKTLTFDFDKYVSGTGSVALTKKE